MLMCELIKQLELAQENLLEAAIRAPLYGILTCIRSVLCQVKFSNIKDTYSLKQWHDLILELITLSIKVASSVEPVVCNSSPEGHLPMDADHENITQLQAAVRRAIGCRFQSALVQPLEQSSNGGLQVDDAVVLDFVKTHAVTAQMLLLCCWRTHKEISLLFGEIAELVPIFFPEVSTENGILNATQVEKIGEYFTRQMSLVKHKGAFEQAYIGFSKLCSRLWRSNFLKLQELPKVWLGELLLAIRGLKENMQLCPTRRSAGLPFIIQALLASEPGIGNSSFFKETMSIFLSLAEDG
ncbi:Thyroid adenoma-associated protein, partial [Stegodyphus mimosarum]